MKVKWDWIIVPNIWENKSHVPNHQPVFLFLSHWLVSLCSRYQNSNLPVPSCLIRPAYSPRLSSVTRVSLPLWWCKCTYTGWWFQPLWKIWVFQWEGLSHILWKITFSSKPPTSTWNICVCVHVAGLHLAWLLDDSSCSVLMKSFFSGQSPTVDVFSWLWFACISVYIANLLSMLSLPRSLPLVLAAVPCLSNPKFAGWMHIF